MKAEIFVEIPEGMSTEDFVSTIPDSMIGAFVNIYDDEKNFVECWEV